MLRQIAALVLLMLLFRPLVAQDAQTQSAWIDLFNGKDMSGWVPVNVAPTTFTAKDGMIVSTGIPTGVLRTEAMYENFVIELEWRHMRPGGNAGLFVWGDGIPSTGIPFTRGVEVQILDNAYGADGKNEWFTTHGDIFPIHGAKMKPQGRVAKRGMRSFPTEELSKSSPEWNHYRVTANNGEIKLSVNGKEVTSGTECWPRKGYIFLESEGSECHFRNIRLQTLPSTGAGPEETARSGDGFVPLFGGTDLAGWKIPEGDNGHWKVQGEVIDYDAASESKSDQSLWSEREYGDFHLVADWRIKETPYVNPNAAKILADGSDAMDENGRPIKLAIPDSDSGIYLRGDSKYQVNIWCWPIGSGEMYGVRRDAKMPAATRAAVTPKTKADRPVGEWNRFEIIARGETVTVQLNGQTVVDQANIPGLPPRGKIALQHHGSKVDGKWNSPPSLVQFRNIMIKEL
jgi:Domain of Unknown Function (DUF1080)